ncbi:MAG: site-specific integrase [Phycisphaeraceae bacterium]|nr:site-specific integrase [Phycisphaeraceae bacterium]MCB9848150.1 site-specific integrase [Phycisphaeraceae bacterium]
MLCDYIEGSDDSSDLVVNRSRQRAEYALGHFDAFCEFEGIDTVADFTLSVQKRYIEKRLRDIRARGFKGSNGTINRELTVLKAALNYAWKHGRLDTVPHIGLLQPPPSRDRFLRQPEVHRLLEACMSEHLKLYVRLALHTLQRPIAIYSLTVDQIDLEMGRIDFLPRGVAQSNKRRPVVPITPTLLPHLEEAIGGSVTGHILEYHGKPISSVKKSFGRAVEQAGLREVTPYTLRHTGATLMAAAGVPLRQIAGMLGHTEARTTEIYAKHHPDFLKDATAAIEDLFGEE